MADLRISELPALSGANLAAGDLLPVVDVSASETKKITIQDTIGYGVTLIADATIPGAKILFSAGTVAGSAIANGGIDTAQLADDAVTAAKLADESTVDLVTTLPASGAYVGQLALDTDDSKVYCWNGSAWVSFKAAGSVNTVVGDTAGIVNLSVATSGDQVTITTSLDDTAAAAQFLAGPTGAAGAVSYRQIASGDLPTATTTGKGAVVVNGSGLTMSGDQIVIDNTIAASGSTYSVVQYDTKGLVTDGRAITGTDLPTATSSVKGGVFPGTGLTVTGAGALNHTNSVAAGSATKVNFDAQGHISSAGALEAADIPNIPATKLTSGILPAERLGDNSVLGAKFADNATALFGESQPTAEYDGQLFFNSVTRDIFIWAANAWQPIGISVGEIIFAGTFDASLGGGTGQVASVTADGTAIGLVVGQPLPAASQSNSRYYLVVSEGGTITSGNAPNVTLAPPDIILSNGTQWTEVDVSQTVTAQLASNITFTPYGTVSGTNVQTAIEELSDEKLAKAGGTLTGNLILDTAVTLTFEGATANDYETVLTVEDPTDDRTITLPDSTGTVALTSDLNDGTY